MAPRSVCQARLPSARGSSRPRSTRRLPSGNFTSSRTVVSVAAGPAVMGVVGSRVRRFLPILSPAWDVAEASAAAVLALSAPPARGGRG